MTKLGKKTKVFFVGSGPGDPELITVKGRRLLGDADIIVYAGSLVKERVLKYARSDADIHDSASMNLEEIMKGGRCKGWEKGCPASLRRPNPIQRTPGAGGYTGERRCSL